MLSCSSSAVWTYQMSARRVGFAFLQAFSDRKKMTMDRCTCDRRQTYIRGRPIMSKFTTLDFSEVHLANMRRFRRSCNTSNYML